jgi:hypothetical protein
VKNAPMSDHSPLPDRDTVDAVVLFDLAITLIAKTDMYPERVVERVVQWLRDPARANDEQDRAHAHAIADVLERVSGEQCASFIVLCRYRNEDSVDGVDRGYVQSPRRTFSSRNEAEQYADWHRRVSSREPIIVALTKRSA